MVRPLRAYHRILWLVLAVLLPLGFAIAVMLSRKLESLYGGMDHQQRESLINPEQIPDLSGKPNLL